MRLNLALLLVLSLLVSFIGSVDATKAKSKAPKAPKPYDSSGKPRRSMQWDPTSASSSAAPASSTDSREIDVKPAVVIKGCKQTNIVKKGLMDGSP